MLLRPLLQRRPDLAFVGRTLFFAPFTHYLRGVYFYSSLYSSAATPNTFAQQLYRGWSYIDYHSRENIPYAFCIDENWKQNVEQTSQWLCDLMEQQLSRAEPIVDFATQVRSPFWPKLHVPLAEATAACTIGDFETAEAIASKNVELNDSDWPFSSVTDDVRYSSDIGWRMPYLLRALRADRSKVIPLLHDWEAYSVHLNKMTKYWKSTPFPCEL